MLTSEVSAYNRRIAALRRGTRGTRDAILSAVPFPSAELDAEAARVAGVIKTDLGMVWTGIDAGTVSTADARRLADGLRRAADAMEAYAGAEHSSSMRVDPSGTLVTAGAADPAAAATDARRRANDASLSQLDPEVRRCMGTNGAFNDAARKFWAGQQRR